MAMRARQLASGPGWSVSDVICSSGPRDRPFEEQHASVCIATVMQGSFQYRTTHGAATLVPGAVVLGNHQSCFECAHDHATGDRCLSFAFDPGYFEAILSSLPGVRSATFSLVRLPPMMSLTHLFAGAELARQHTDSGWFEQLALDVAAKATRVAAGTTPADPSPTRRDQQRIASALRHLDTAGEPAPTIAELASDAAMSPFHFLRTFRRVAGITPHQYILRRRLLDAAVALRRSSRPVLDIALDAGFTDLSTFNRQFRATMATTPSGYRRRADQGAASG